MFTNKQSDQKKIQPSSNTQQKLFPIEANQQPSKGRNKTRITIKYDVGFSNSLYLRGKGANLSWDRGVPLKNVKNDEWVWETDAPFNTCEFKVLINDQRFEEGENHPLNPGGNISYTPRF